MYLHIISRENINMSQYYSGYIVGQECNNHRKLFALWQNGEGRCVILASGLPQGRNGLGRQGDPPRPMWGGLQPIQFSRMAPIRDRGHRHVEQGGRRLGTITAVTALPV